MDPVNNERACIETSVSVKDQTPHTTEKQQKVQQGTMSIYKQHRIHSLRWEVITPNLLWEWIKEPITVPFKSKHSVRNYNVFIEMLARM